MMNDTKQIKAFYEHDLVKKLNKVANKIKKEGFSRDVYTELRFLENDLKCLNAVKGFVDAWHEDGELVRIVRGA